MSTIKVDRIEAKTPGGTIRIASPTTRTGGEQYGNLVYEQYQAIQTRSFVSQSGSSHMSTSSYTEQDVPLTAGIICKTDAPDFDITLWTTMSQGSGNAMIIALYYRKNGGNWVALERAGTGQSNANDDGLSAYGWIYDEGRWGPRNYRYLWKQGTTLISPSDAGIVAGDLIEFKATYRAWSAANTVYFLHQNGMDYGWIVSEIASSESSSTYVLEQPPEAAANTAPSGNTAPSSVPTGAVFHFAMLTAPDGYLVCDGSDVSREDYADLFTAIGETFGAGNGVTTFTLPDLAGEFIRGHNASADTGPDAGRTFGTRQVDAVSEHNHWFTSTSATQGGANDGAGTFSTDQTTTSLMSYGDTGSGGYLGSASVNTRGNFRIDRIKSTISGSETVTDGPETRPTNVALLPCIKT